MAADRQQDQAKKITLTVNGRQVTGRSGQTILEVCRENGIEIPTLCHFEGLKPVGACRLCVVEIAGQRKLSTACTTPAEDGMVIQTDTPRLRDLRRRTLELLFSERNHICPFCPQAGDCELQNLAYQHGITHVRYDYLLPSLPMDSSHPYIALDHNRCVLCTRCVRVCDEWVGVHALDLRSRGSTTMIGADLGVPLAESSCISCGMCVEVCPTGALFDKLSSHIAGKNDLPAVASICTACPVGCWIEVKRLGRTLVQINSGKGPDGNRIICGIGRYEALKRAGLRDIHRPRLKRAGRWVEVDWQEAVGEIARRMTTGRPAAEPNRIGAMISPTLPLETAATIRQFFKEVIGSESIGILQGPEDRSAVEAFSLEGNVPPVARLQDLERADGFVVIGCDLARVAPVLGSYITRAIHKRGATFVEVNPRSTALSAYADLRITVRPGGDSALFEALLRLQAERGLLRNAPPEDVVRSLTSVEDPLFQHKTGLTAGEVNRLASALAKMTNPIFVVGTGLTSQGAASLRALLNLLIANGYFTADGHYSLLEVPRYANGAGVRALFEPAFDLSDLDPARLDMLLLFAGEQETAWPAAWLEKLRPLVHVAVFAVRDEQAVEYAHSALPVPTWAEREGCFVNVEGRLQRSQQIVKPPTNVWPEEKFLTELAKALGRPFQPNPQAYIPASLQVATGSLVPAAETLREVVPGNLPRKGG